MNIYIKEDKSVNNHAYPHDEHIAGANRTTPLTTIEFPENSSLARNTPVL
jgi:hypothetical protein